MKKNLMRGYVKRLARVLAMFGVMIFLSVLATQQVHAEVIDNIEIKQTGDQAEIQLHFITRIQYKRQMALKNGDIRIYLTLLDIKADDKRLTRDKKDSPPSDIVSPFTVTYPELDTSLTLSFGKVLKYRVRAGKDERSLSIFTKALAAKKKNQDKPAVVVAPVAGVAALPIAAAAVASASTTELPAPIIQNELTGVADLPSETQQKTPEQVQQEAQQLFVAASDALQNNQVEASIDALNKVLNLPPNVLTQPAQELMGEAREKNGEFVKARAEYELYLKLYPNAADLKQVQARIANLPKEDAVQQMKTMPSEAKQKAAEEKLQFTGGISQNYYRGAIHSDTFSTDGVSAPTITTFSATDQSMLITNVDMTARKRTEKLDTRFVLRDFNRINFLPGQADENRWNAIYFEQSARDRKFMYRLGRQPGSTVGVPGRFDGAAGGYSLNSMWRINAALGIPVEYASGSNANLTNRKMFYSGSVDLTRLPDQWSGSLYGVIQYVGGYREAPGGLMNKGGGIRERAAFGLEAHYFETGHSYLTQIEFDTIYHKMNLATFQGNWTRESGLNYYMTLDHRRSPPLYLNLTGQFSQNAKEVVKSGKITIEELRANAIALSPFSNMFAMGASRPITPKLRLATDFRVSNTAGTGDYITTSLTTGQGTQLGSPGTGNQYAFSMQAIGNDFLFNDLGIVNVSLTSTETTKGQSLAFSQVQTFRKKWRFDEALQIFNQNSTDDTRQTQIRPSVTINYRMTETMNFSAEMGLEQYRTRSANADDKTRRKYLYLGYRYDFR